MPLTYSTGQPVGRKTQAPGFVALVVRLQAERRKVQALLAASEAETVQRRDVVDEQLLYQGRIRGLTFAIEQADTLYR